MTKMFLALSMLALTVTAHARGGSDDGRAPRGSQAWLMNESIEHSMRLLPIAQANGVDEILAEKVNADTVNVVLTFEDGSSRALTCVAFDHASRSGTVIKKEVACR